MERYRAWAMIVVGAGAGVVWVGLSGFGVDCISPGKKNVAGEMDCVVVTPPQAVPNKRTNGIAAKIRSFRSNRTVRTIKRVKTLATANSLTSGTRFALPELLCKSGHAVPGVRFRGGLLSWLAAVVGILVLSSSVCPANEGTDPVSPAARTEQDFLLHRARYQMDRSNPAVAWNFARTCFDWADFAKNNDQREGVAQQGIEAARRAVSLRPDSAAAHYYLALNLGQLARTKTVGALKLVVEMEKEFLAAIELDERFDYAGPHRSLGILYRDAPGWPASIGSRSKSRTNLERAVQLFPNYPGNRLSLAEGCILWGDRTALLSQTDELRKLIPAARKEFEGKEWETSWTDWDERWEKVRRSVARMESKQVR